MLHANHLKAGRYLLAAVLLLAQALPSSAQPAANSSGTWTKQAANAWYSKEPWLVGSNYLPADAINQLEMWQAATFDPKRIDLELGWAQGLGMNTMRVFLHDLLWEQDSEGFKKRIDTFLTIADEHKIKPIFVLFDSCWNPYPHLGKQPAPKPGVHNSGWVESPGVKELQDPSQYPHLEAYVKGVVGAFAKDQRVLAWDIWNEPDNLNGSSYGKEEPKNVKQLVLALLPRAFAWARSVHPQQPLTSCLWEGDWSSYAKLSPMAKEELDLSDVISFHNYDPPASFEQHVKWLQQYGRPIICTEYMARPKGSTFQAIMPLEKKDKIGAINWGFVAGKSQTYLPWDSWQHPYVDHPPAVWFHDIFRTDGKPYRPEEVKFIRQITGATAQ